MFLAFAPQIACVIGAAGAVAFDAFERRGLAVFSALGGVSVAAALAYVAAMRPPELTGGVVLSGAGFSGAVAVIFLVAAVVLLGSWKSLAGREFGGGVAALLAVVTVAATMAATAADLLVLLIALEAMALCAYALVWSARTSASVEASVKYFVQGAVATGLFVMGLAILFGLYGGSTSYVAIRGVMGSQSGPPVTTAFVLIAVALAYKLGAFPFHSWALDAFETAPPYASAILAGIPKLAAAIAAVILFARSVFAGISTEYQLWVFGVLAVGSMVFGATGGLRQRSYTRMLAYSGVAQIGYALVGVALGAVAMTAVAVLVGAYAVAAAGAFLAAGAFRAVQPDWDGSIAGLAGLGRDRPLLGAAVVVAMFSLVGMPLTAGFWGKFLVFGVAVSTGYWWLALVGVVASVVSFGYYGAVLRTLYFETPQVGSESAPDGGVTPDRPAEIAVIVSALIVLGVGTVPLVTGLQWLLRLLTFA